MPKESVVLSDVKLYLDERKDQFWWRNNTLTVNMGTLSKPRWVVCGEKGAADILSCWAPTGRFVAIETKRTKGGKQDDDQKRWEEDFVKFGGIYILAAKDPRAAILARLGPPTVQLQRWQRGARVYPGASEG